MSVKLLRLLARLPKDQYARFQVEETDGRDGGPVGPFLTLCVFTETPEGGWETEGDYFDHPPDHPRYAHPCPERWWYDDRVEFGVSGVIGREREFEADCIAALERHLEKGGRK